MGTLSRAAAVRRELPASWHIPYAAHLAPEVIVTRAGDYVQTLRLAGASFESATINPALITPHILSPTINPDATRVPSRSARGGFGAERMRRSYQ